MDLNLEFTVAKKEGSLGVETVEIIVEAGVHSLQKYSMVRPNFLFKLLRPYVIQLLGSRAYMVVDEGGGLMQAPTNKDPSHNQESEICRHVFPKVCIWTSRFLRGLIGD